MEKVSFPKRRYGKKLRVAYIFITDVNEIRNIRSILEKEGYELVALTPNSYDIYKVF